MELDPEKVTNNMDEAAVQAELLKAFQGNSTQQQHSKPLQELTHLTQQEQVVVT